MNAALPPETEAPLVCPYCGETLDQLVVNPAGELIGCEECAEELALAGEVMTLDEWNAPTLVQSAMDQYALTDWRAAKPQLTETQRPRAHFWEVYVGNKHYFLKQFHSWYPVESIRYTHSILAHLVDQGLPAPRVIPSASGASFAEVDGSHWALYQALEGRHATERDWMWGRPKAAEMLGALHHTLEGFTPEGEPFQPWGAWTLETVDRVLENWRPHPDLSPDLLAFVRERLATRYFGMLYPQLPKLVVHGDFMTTNVLWRGDSVSAAISGVVDFERAHPDTALFDFAWGLGDRRPPLLRATVASYSRMRPLSPVEREALPESLLLGQLMAIDMQMSYFNNMREVSRLAQELLMTVRDMESLRKAVALRVGY